VRRLCQPHYDSIMSSQTSKQTLTLKVASRTDGKRDIHTKLTISEDRTSSRKQASLVALKDRSKPISLKGGRFEAGVGKKDQASKSNSTSSKTSDPREDPNGGMEEVD
jgi:hypothetical protein